MANMRTMGLSPDQVVTSPSVWYCQVPSSLSMLDADDHGKCQQLDRRSATRRPFSRLPTHLFSPGIPAFRPLELLQVWWRQFSMELVPPLRVRDFRLLFVGQLISSMGDQFYLVALPWLILDRGGTPQDLGLVLSAYGVPRLAALLAGGKLSDRLRPRSVMLVADVVRAFVLLGLTGYALIGHPPLWLLCLIVVPLGLFTGLFLPASYSIAPDLVPVEQLQAANAITGSSQQLARLVGPGLGGVIVGHLRASAALAADALSFVASVVTLAAIRREGGDQPRRASYKDAVAAPSSTSATQLTHEAQESPSAAGRARNATSVGLWHLIRKSPLLRAVLTFVGIANVTSGGVIEVALPGYAHGPLAAGATGYGLILGAWGAGAFIGGIAAGGFGRTRRKGQLMLLVTLGESAGIALTPLVGHLFGLLGVVIDLAAFGLANGLSNVLLISLVQQAFPRHLLGRVMGAFLLAAYGIYPLSVTLGGWASQHFGPAAMFFLAGLMLLSAVLYAWLQGALRSVSPTLAEMDSVLR